MSRIAKHSFERTGAPPTTAKGHHGINGWIVPGGAQILNPFLVGSRELAPFTGDGCGNLQMAMLLITAFA